VIDSFSRETSTPGTQFSRYILDSQTL
jgi:hypothetical protein